MSTPLSEPFPCHAVWLARPDLTHILIIRLAVVSCLQPLAKSYGAGSFERSETATSSTCSSMPTAQAGQDLPKSLNDRLLRIRFAEVTSLLLKNPFPKRFIAVE